MPEGNGHPAADILREAGLPFAPCAFNNPPDETYAVYSEEVTRRGADALNCISEHDVAIEVYSYDFYDGDAVRAVARALDRRAVEYRKYGTTYINSEHLYCTRFEFEIVAKDSVAERLDRAFDFQSDF